MSCMTADEVEDQVSRSTNAYTGFDYEIGADESVQPCIPGSPHLPERWGIVLAGGDGTRLQGLTRIISGDDRPKQFCALVGSETLLEQAGRRASRSIAPEQTIVALTRSHARYYSHDLAGTCFKRLVQPCNRGTAPPIIISLLHIARLNPGALVAVLPSDHYYSDEDTFTRALGSAFEVADSRRSSVVLLGAQPRGPEIEFGWIELGAPVDDELFRVSTFEEKPTLEVARRLHASGALWNTFVLVGSVDALIEMAFASLPDLVISFFDKLKWSTNSGTLQIPDALYNATPSTDFSRRVLSPNAHRLLALRLRSMEWHDLGHPDRVVSIVRSREKAIPVWMHLWEAAKISTPHSVSAL